MKRIAGCAALEPGYDVVVVGAGPAGMGAAASAAELGASVLLVDEGDDPGGQIYRAIDRTPVTDVEILGPDYWKGRSIVERFAASACSYLPKASVWHLDGDCVVGIVAEGAARLIRARRVILATGAIERPFPLVGWTLPGVMTVGAAQILLKTAAAVPRGRTVLVGTGPLLWLYASQCIKAGERPTILDTSPAGNRLRALRFAPAFLASPYVRKGLQLLRDVRAGARVISGVNPLSIEAGERESQVLRIKYERGGAQHMLEADQVLLHQGVVPNVNLANAAGCALVWNEAQAAWQPRTDAHGESSVPGISILGDAAGIAGAEIAGLSGSIGGLRIAAALTGRDGRALEEKIRPLRADLQRYCRGRAFLDALYLPAQRQRTGGPDAIVCRCEEITGRQVTETARTLKVSGPNQMKVFLRTGMGPCQGRYCGATVAELIAAERGLPLSEVGYLHLRTPARPLTLGELATVPSTDAEMASVY